jgi:hypothetical protein
MCPWNAYAVPAPRVPKPTAIRDVAMASRGLEMYIRANPFLGAKSPHDDTALIIELEYQRGVAGNGFSVARTPWYVA